MAQSALQIVVTVIDKGSAALSSVASGLTNVSKAAKQYNADLGTITTVTDTVIGTVSKVGVALAVMASAKWLFNLASQFQQFEAQLEVMYGSAEKAKEVFAAIQEFAARTPFDVEQVMRYWIQLKAYGLEPNLETIRTIGDAVSALGGKDETFAGIVRALGQMQSRGKLAQQEITQLSTHGVPALEMLRQKFQITGDVVEGLRKKGIGVHEAIQAIYEGMRTRFGGQMEAMSKRLGGLFANLTDNVKNFFYAIMNAGPIQSFTAAIAGVIDAMTEWMRTADFREFAQEVGQNADAIIKYVKNILTEMMNFGRGMYESTGVLGTVVKAIRGLGEAFNITLKDAIEFFIIWKTAAFVLGPVVGIFGSVLKSLKALDSALLTLQLGSATKQFTTAGHAASALLNVFNVMASGASQLMIFDKMSVGAAVFAGKIVALIQVAGMLAVVLWSVKKVWDLVVAMKEAKTAQGELLAKIDNYKTIQKEYAAYKDTVIRGEDEINAWVAKGDKDSLAIYQTTLARRVGYWEAYLNELYAKKPTEIVTADMHGVSSSNIDAVIAWKNEVAKATQEVVTAKVAYERTRAASEALGLAFDSISKAQKRLNLNSKESGEVINTMRYSVDDARKSIKTLDDQYKVAASSVERYYDTLKTQTLSAAKNDLERQQAAGRVIAIEAERASTLIKLAEDEAAQKSKINNRILLETAEAAEEQDRITKELADRKVQMSEEELKNREEALKQLQKYAEDAQKEQIKIEQDLLKTKTKILEEWVKETQRAYNEASRAAQQYKKEIEALEYSKIKNKVATEDRIREIQSRTWSEEKIYNENRKAAYAALSQARTALAAADEPEEFARATEWANRASSLFEKLAGTAEGDAAAIRGLTSANNLNNEVLEKEIELKKKAQAEAEKQMEMRKQEMSLMEQQIASLNSLNESIKSIVPTFKVDANVDPAKEKIDNLETQTPKDMAVNVTANTDDLVAKVKAIQEERTEKPLFVTPNTEQFDAAMQRLTSATQHTHTILVDASRVDEARARIQQNTWSVHTIYVNRVETDKVGGEVGRYEQGGWPSLRGKLPGWGGGDKIRALLEAGEFIIRKEAVQKYGVALFHALNGMRVEVPSATDSAARMAEGGAVAAKVIDEMVLRLQAGDSEVVANVRGNRPREVIRAFEKELRKMGLANA